jgi:hypothetical protein
MIPNIICPICLNNLSLNKEIKLYEYSSKNYLASNLDYSCHNSKCQDILLDKLPKLKNIKNNYSIYNNIINTNINILKLADNSILCAGYSIPFIYKKSIICLEGSIKYDLPNIWYPIKNSIKNTIIILQDGEYSYLNFPISDFNKNKTTKLKYSYYEFLLEVPFIPIDINNPNSSKDIFDRLTKLTVFS